MFFFSHEVQNSPATRRKKPSMPGKQKPGWKYFSGLSLYDIGPQKTVLSGELTNDQRNVLCVTALKRMENIQNRTEAVWQTCKLSTMHHDFDTNFTTLVLKCFPRCTMTFTRTLQLWFYSAFRDAP